jgi:hypothetical protein
MNDKLDALLGRLKLLEDELLVEIHAVEEVRRDFEDLKKKT